MGDASKKHLAQQFILKKVELNLSNKREIITTNDGSHSLLVPELNEQYHSVHGAKQEAEHVFLKMGLDGFCKGKSCNEINVFEVGFGTGLNALLSADWAKSNSISLNYTSIEKYPVTEDEFALLNYGDLLGEAELYNKITAASWEEYCEITKFFNLKKLAIDLTEDVLPKGFDVVYFDAFAPNKQPKLWEIVIFEKMFDIMNSKGILVTYCCQGQARRNMIAAGFEVEKVPGPPGKREMLRARKP